MISPQSSFKFIDRGHREALVLVPGWASDCRIFSGIDCGYNYFICAGMNDVDFTDILLRSLDRAGLERVAILGWSMGGYLAYSFARLHPSRVSALTLVGVRESFDAAVLAEIRAKLRKNRKAFLYSFYRDCFSGKDAQGCTRFRRLLMKPYLDAMTLDGLTAGLDYLARVELVRLDRGSGPAMRGQGIPITIIHGADDAIVPVGEGRELARRNNAVFVELKGLGHCPFMNAHFQKCGPFGERALQVADYGY